MKLIAPLTKEATEAFEDAVKRTTKVKSFILITKDENSHIDVSHYGNSYEKIALVSLLKHILLTEEFED